MNNSSILVRPSLAQDYEQLINLDHAAWDVNSSPGPIHWESIEEYAKRHTEGSQLVAVMGEVICGYIHTKPPTPLESNQHVTELAIAVHPKYQGIGVGKILMQAVEEKAREEVKRKISLRVLATNESAIRFYQKLGYKEQGRLIDEFFLNGRYVDDIFMYKMLSNE